ncbi:L-threonine 3-dehydrogenase [Clostridiisalibacter paucivorans]|uniref:L-threonine 3-dehydrogenase n=1 Tax=Clostridiisalibacter paucivorans TaxID=408753 RepID=UPI00047E1082|nr:L-threonine 3-dehydrogenase [Clostridiisalibacter paucivorans]
MKKILITGALGQIGSELTMKLRDMYGSNNIIGSGINKRKTEVTETGPFEIVDVTNAKEIYEAAKKHNVDWIVHLAAILSATGEKKPELAWNVNMNGLYNILEVARENGCGVFTPSSIAAFGPSTPKDNTPQDTLQRPETMYGVTKVAGELLCDYYFKKYGVDTRGVRFPGLISYKTLPGGGTTDYAVHIYYEALKNKRYTSPIARGTYMDMMYMPDAIDAIINLMEADGAKLTHRNAFNVTAMSFEPNEIYNEIKRHIPDFQMDYDVDENLQKIADSWPNSLNDTMARDEWGWNPKYDLAKMTQDMLEKLKTKI